MAKAKGSISRMTTPEEKEFDRRNAGKISGSSNNRGDVHSQQRRASIGAYNTVRNSKEKLDSLIMNNSQKSIPHYLRASTGSCHDFCKYGRKNAFESKERLIIPKRIGKLKLPSNEQNVVVNQKPSPYPPETIKREIVLPSKDSKVPSSVQSKTATDRLSSSPDTSAGISGEGRRNCIVVKNGASVKKPMATKISLGRTSSVKSRKPVSIKVISPLKDPNRTRDSETKRSSNEKMKIPEMTLHVVRTDDDPITQSRPSPSAPSSLSLAKKDDSEVNGNPVKLKFRKGKVVELKSGNSNLRRLRFRRERVLPEEQDAKADLRSKSFKNAVVIDDKNGANPSSEKVVLKHQEVEEKKDDQGLLNNVIEETASRLVESRKSKVKALVGAFETVISLSRQERKPPSHKEESVG